MIYICNLHDMSEYARALRAGYLVSIVQPEFQPPTPRGIRADRHLRIAVHDISEPGFGEILPEEAHVQELLDYLRSWPGDEPLLMHCYAGVSRSMAAALIALCLEADGRELEAARVLRAAAPHAQPNALMVALADRLLSRGGRLVAARRAMGPATLVLDGPLVALPASL